MKSPAAGDTIFTKIIKREIPATIRYEDDDFIAIDDISPIAPVHVLIIPKHPYPSLEAVELEDATFHATLLQLARSLARKLDIDENYKLLINVGAQVQAVPHLHVHLIGGWHRSTPREELDDATEKLL